jgi:hypothetical protein
VGAPHRPLVQAEKLELLRDRDRSWKISDSLDLIILFEKP